jgi:hypothetical protein
VKEIVLLSSHIMLDLAAPSTAEDGKQGSPNDSVWGNRIGKWNIGKGRSVHRDKKFVIPAIPCYANCCTFMQEPAYTIHGGNFGPENKFWMLSGWDTARDNIERAIHTGDILFHCRC